MVLVKKIWFVMCVYLCGNSINNHSVRVRCRDKVRKDINLNEKQGVDRQSPQC